MARPRSGGREPQGQDYTIPGAHPSGAHLPRLTQADRIAVGLGAAAAALEIDRGKLAEICRRHHIRRLSVFGSALRGDFGAGSDVDFLVEFDRRFPVGLRIFDVEADLAPLIGGRRPDLVNPKFLNPRLKSEILASARVLFEEG